MNPGLKGLLTENPFLLVYFPSINRAALSHYRQLGLHCLKPRCDADAPAQTPSGAWVLPAHLPGMLEDLGRGEAGGALLRHLLGGSVPEGRRRACI